VSSDYSADVLPLFFLAWLSILNENMHITNIESMTPAKAFEVSQSILEFNKSQILKCTDFDESQSTKALVAQVLSHRLLKYSLDPKKDTLEERNIEKIVEIVEEIVDRLYLLEEDKKGETDMLGGNPINPHLLLRTETVTFLNKLYSSL
jgi:hypothetical protein